MEETMQKEQNSALTILRLTDVKARTGLSRSTIYQRVADGTFPQQISLGARAVGWVEQSITDWIEQQIAASGKVAA
jgi:prophage regulatory protein